MSNYIIRQMSQQELAQYAMAWAAAEGWRPGYFDAEYYYPIDPDGFFLGFLDDEPIASISAVKYGNNFGFIGLYIVKPNYRGQGFGLQIWQRAMAYLHGYNIGLDGVISQQANYQKSGFKTAYRHLRYQVQGMGQTYQHPHLRPISEIDIQALQQYDAQLYLGDRRDFIRHWVEQKQGMALAVANQQQLSGYGVIRSCYDGYRIGGWYADNAEDAEILLLGLLSYAPMNSPVFVDIPEPNAVGIALAAKYNMSLVFETARMYTRNVTDNAVPQTFGITSLEIG